MDASRSPSRDPDASASPPSLDGHVEGASAGAERYLVDWSREILGRARLVARPRTVAEVQAFVRWCVAEGISIVPQGGNTGLVAGGIPDDATYAVLSLERLDRIRSVDRLNFTLRADAGAVLQTVKDAAEAEGMIFPLALGAQGSCRIGGNVATNAGGINVLRYGMMRDLVTGLEVVLPDGSLLDDMNGLRKDNRGYDLKQLIVGSEGTLGIVTGVELKLSARPTQVESAYLGLAGFAEAAEFYRLARQRSSDLLSAFEVIGEECLPLAGLIDPALRSPLADAWPVHAIVELSCGAGIDARGLLESLLVDAIEADVAGDAVVAQSRAQAAAFWSIREGLVEGQARQGFHVRTDLSVKLGDVPALIERARACVARGWPLWRPLAYGHAGDGNIHFNVLPPNDMPEGRAREHGKAILAALYAVVGELGGSFSAEHGIGRSRREAFWAGMSPVERRLHAAIKAAFDPHGLLNPGCLLPPDSVGEAA